MTRPIPDFCEYQADGGERLPTVKCRLRPRWEVSVAGLSPLFVCASHGIVLRKQWSPWYSVKGTPINIARAEHEPVTVSPIIDKTHP